MNHYNKKKPVEMYLKRVNNSDPIIVDRQLRISVTSRCNMRCSYCHNEGSSEFVGDLTYEDVIHIIEISLKYKFKEIRFTGGEPCLHPDLEKMCAYIKRYYPKIKVSVNSNGTLIDVLRRLFDMNLIDRVVIGLDYFDRGVSKDSSVGLSSEEIKKDIIKLKIVAPETGRVGVNSAYSGILDDKNVYQMIDWCLEKKINLKILEQVDVYSVPSFDRNHFDDLVDDIFNKYPFERLYDVDGSSSFVDKNGTAVRFIYSFCRIGACVHCMSKNVRVKSNGSLSRCLRPEIEFSLLCENYEDSFAQALDPMLKL